MFGLSIPILLLRTEQGPTGLILLERWRLVFAVCGLVFLARIAVGLLGGDQGLLRRARMRNRAVSVSADPSKQSLSRVAALATPLFIGAALVFPLAIYLVQGGLSESRYWIDLGILILTYVMLGWGLNIVVGLAGLLDLGYVAFYAVGAYSYALLSTTYGLSFWICLPLAGILAAFWGILLGFPVLRLRGDYLAIVTLAFGEIIRLVLINWVDVTGGGAGISSIPRVTFFGVPFTADEDGFAALFGLTFNPMHRVIFSTT
jgi:branched-chain amino acid transport system permease protein